MNGSLKNFGLEPRWDYVRRKTKATSNDKFPYLTNIEIRQRALQPIDEFFMVFDKFI